MDALFQFANNNPGTTLLIIVVLALTAESIAIVALRSKKD